MENLATDAAPIAPTEGSEQWVKRKVCIYFGYVGERYCGLQLVKTEGINTVERELLEAFHKGGFMTDANYDCTHPLQKNGWERASRTDKGVHALKNLISVRLQFPLKATQDNDFTHCVETLNKILPTDIRVYKIQPVTSSFNAYMMCVGRRYQYYLPTCALCSKEEFDTLLPHAVAPQFVTEDDMGIETEGQEATEGAEEEADAGEGSHTGEKRSRNKDEDDDAKHRPASSKNEPRRVNNDIKYGAEPMNVFKNITEEHMKRLATYRINATNLERARRLFQLYLGTKPFHNFTPGGKPSNMATMRYMQKITVNEPEVLVPSLAEGQENEALQRHLTSTYAEGMEWVRIEIEGQSFMLNQIRKMIGCVISVMVLGLPDYFVTDCVQTNVIRGIPMAPANGLFLSYLDFALYNKRLDRIQNQPGVNGHGKQTVDMDFEEHAVSESLKESNPSAYEKLVAEQKATKALVKQTHKNILATVSRRECCEDITGRWLRSVRHVSRLCYRMEFGPNDDPLRYEKAPEPVASRTNKKGRTEAPPSSNNGTETLAPSTN